eukprot:Rmarinus@m.7202
MTILTHTIDLSDTVFGLSFHPERNIVATSLISGELFLYDLQKPKEPRRIFSVQAHNESCRSVCFGSEGSRLYTASADKSIGCFDAETGKRFFCRENAHEGPVNCIEILGETTFATGDDDGAVKVWDTRTLCAKASPTMEFKEQSDFVSDMAYDRDSQMLLCGSGDGTLAVYGLRSKKGKLQALSDDVEDEILSVEIVKNRRKVACGTQDGIVALWTWDDWGDYKDRFVGHPVSVDAITKISEHMIVTGASDGMLRVVTIHPNDLLCVLGEHEDAVVQCLATSSNESLLVSSASDGTVKIWDMDEFRDALEASDDDDEDEGHSDGETAAGSANLATPGVTTQECSPKNTASGSDDDDSSSDSDSGSEKAETGLKRKREQARDRANKVTKTDDFFADL